MVHSNMIAKKIEVSIINTSLKKPRIHWREYEWEYSEGIIRNNIPTMLYLLLKSNSPDTRIGVSNLKDEIEKSTLAKFEKNTKYFLDGISSNYTIIIDNRERH